MATFTDDFERADSTDLGANWVEPTGAGNWAIFSGAIGVQSGDGRNLVRCVQATATADMDVEAVVSAGTGGVTAVAARVNDGASESTSSYYRFGTNGTAWRIDRIASNVLTNLVSSAEAPPAAPYTLRLRVVGSTLTGYVNGVQKVTVTDSGITGNTKGGLAAFGSNGQRYSTFTVADVGGGPAMVIVPTLILAAALVAPVVTGAGSTPATVTVPALAAAVSLEIPEVETTTIVTADTLAVAVVLVPPVVTGVRAATVAVPVLATTVSLTAPAVTGAAPPARTITAARRLGPPITVRRLP